MSVEFSIIPPSWVIYVWLFWILTRLEIKSDFMSPYDMFAGCSTNGPNHIRAYYMWIYELECDYLIYVHNHALVLLVSGSLRETDDTLCMVWVLSFPSYCLARLLALWIWFCLDQQTDVTYLRLNMPAAVPIGPNHIECIIRNLCDVEFISEMLY